MDILKYLNSISITVTLDNIIVASILIILIVIVIYFIYGTINFFLKKKFKIVTMNINIANIGSVSIEKNRDISKIAHKAWVEIMTRKVGLLFEEDKDVIVEVYNSWYALFGIIRELLKEIEPMKKDAEIEKLEDILIKTLNYGLRPHLTKWQAKFRRWYEQEIGIEENQKLSPQEIQRKYDKYDELVEDLKKTNKQMVQFAEELKKLI
mgnify:FL=1